MRTAALIEILSAFSKNELVLLKLLLLVLQELDLDLNMLRELELDFIEVLLNGIAEEQVFSVPLIYENSVVGHAVFARFSWVIITIFPVNAGGLGLGDIADSVTRVAEHSWFLLGNNGGDAEGDKFHFFSF